MKPKSSNVLTTTVSSLAMAIGLASASATVQAEETVADAIKNGSAKLSFRLRYEDVNDDATTKEDANAITLKSRITLKSAEFKKVSALLEVDDVTALGDKDYNDLVNGKSQYATIADPEGTEVNQAYLAYSGVENTTVKWGRQRILLDNQRFVGGVGWRQNEQTYDALSITNKSLPNTTLFYANVNNVNRIVGEDSAGGDHEHSTHLINAKYSGLSAGTLTAYAYLIDNEDSVGASSDTYGLRFAGGKEIKDGLKLVYEAEYATQSDADDNTVDYDADYYHLVGGVNVKGVTVKVGQEVLESDDSADISGSATQQAFATPLATLHKFNGWSDKFLNTPAAGIEDTYVSIGTKVAGVKLLAVYHDYESNEDPIAGGGSLDYGNEVGFLVAKKFDNYGLALKYSKFDADDATSGVGDGTDISKLWVTASANF